jgi:hypothetical protein
MPRLHDLHNSPILSGAQWALDSLTYEYKGRRPAAETLLNQFQNILVEAEEFIGRRETEIEDAARERADAYAKGRIAQAEREAQKARADAKEDRESYEAILDAYNNQRQVKETRDSDGEKVSIRISNGVNLWSVANLEEVAYRLRLAGADDDTPITLDRTTVAAKVPDPNMITLAPVGQKAPEATTTLWDSLGRAWYRFRWGALALAASGGIGLVTGIFAR